MKPSLVLALLAALLTPSSFAISWTTDHDAALATARQQKRATFLFFTGSDWCPWCKRLDAEILSTKQFQTFADENLVLVKIDFPKHSKLPSGEAERNEQLAKRYAVHGFPRIVVLSPEGKPLGDLGYVPGGAYRFLEELMKVPQIEWRTPRPGSRAGAPSSSRPDAPPDTPLFNGAPVFPPKRYDELQLKGIMGTAQRPMVLINNQTFFAGETARVKLKDGEVKVTCREIRPKSAMVQVEGGAEVKEIFLR